MDEETKRDLATLSNTSTVPCKSIIEYIDLAFLTTGKVHVGSRQLERLT